MTTFPHCQSVTKQLPTADKTNDMQKEEKRFSVAGSPYRIRRYQISSISRLLDRRGVIDVSSRSVVEGRERGQKKGRNNSLPWQAQQSLLRTWKNGGEKLFLLTGTLRTSSVRGRKQGVWTVQASDDNEVSITEDKPTAAAAAAANITGTRSSEENKNGPPILTIIAGLIVFAAFLYVAGSALFWFIGLFFK
ncbi:hypothetical protein R1flu_006034 [Riccia fluitans]|uniref:Uncharacterized protein n=1 Tax=Riccia fluitans TaxID=41844 RepID=A0ABD1YVR0_9MARC